MMPVSRAVFKLLVAFLFLHPAGWMVGLHAQSDLRLSIPARIDAGINFAKVDRDEFSNWFQRPGSAVLLGSGVSLRYKERVVLTSEGGVLLDTYNFFSNYATYDVTHIVSQVRVNGSYNFLFRNDRTKAITVGCDFGRSFIGRNLILRDRGNHFIRSETFGPSVNFISPEIGFTRIWSSGQMSFLLAYVHYRTDHPTVQVEITEPNNARFTATAIGDYLCLRLRANFDVKGHKQPKQEYTVAPEQELALDFQRRDTRVRRELTSKQRVITIRLWDNADIDGDTVSVTLNGRFILTSHALDRRPHKIRVVLEPGQNVIAVHAHNEGRVPPNTAACSIRTGWFKKENLVFSTGLNRNESVVVYY
jgi:hypothetical protein